MAGYDVVIIGAGLGGLLTASILSREGFNVCVLEKNQKLGGALQTFGRKGCVFNTGLNYTESLDNGQILHQYFRYFGLIDRIKLRKMDPNGFEVIDFPDGQYKFAMGLQHFVDTLSVHFPTEREGLKAYAEKLSRICSRVSLYTLEEHKHRSLFDYDLSVGAADYIRSVISNNRLRNILAGNSLMYAGHEQKTPLFIHALINHSFIGSAWRIVDGSHQLVNILAENIVKAGGTILRGQRVVKMITESGKIGQVQLASGERIQGRYFIVSIHPDHLLEMIDSPLLKRSFTARIESLEDTMGMFTLYLVFKKNTFHYMNYNFYHYNQDNVWIASDYQPERWPQHYLFMHTATSHGDQYAESGSVITYMDYNELRQWENSFTGNREETYNAFKIKKAEALLDSMEQQFPGLRSCVEAYYTSTPLTWRDYTGTRAGSAYGLMKDYNRPLESIILPRTKVPNVFLTGQNTNVHGILGVTISSVVTCSELIDSHYLIKKIRNA